MNIPRNHRNRTELRTLDIDTFSNVTVHQSRAPSTTISRKHKYEKRERLEPFPNLSIEDIFLNPNYPQLICFQKGVMIYDVR